MSLNIGVFRATSPGSVEYSKNIVIVYDGKKMVIFFQKNSNYEHFQNVYNQFNFFPV